MNCIFFFVELSFKKKTTVILQKFNNETVLNEIQSLNATKVIKKNHLNDKVLIIIFKFKFALNRFIKNKKIC